MIKHVFFHVHMFINKLIGMVTQKTNAVFPLDVSYVKEGYAKKHRMAWHSNKMNIEQGSAKKARGIFNMQRLTKIFSSFCRNILVSSFCRTLYSE